MKKRNSYANVHAFFAGKTKGKNEILDEVRTEINDLRNQDLFGVVSNHDLLDVVLEIVDKHKRK